MKLSDLTKDERSLLLFLETCAVDQGGLVDVRHMNTDDFAIAKTWNESKFIRMGRIASEDLAGLQVGGKAYTQWVELSDEAMNLARLRRSKIIQVANRAKRKTGSAYIWKIS